MLKFFLLTASLWAASMPFHAETALTRPLTAEKSSDINKPVCYMQTLNGETVNLSSLCIKKPIAQPQAVIKQNNSTSERGINQTETPEQATTQNEVFDANGNKVKTTSTVTCTGSDCNAVITPVSPGE